MTQHPYAHLLQTNSPQNNFPSQNQRTLYNLLKEDFKIPHFHIYLVILYIK